MSQFDIQQVAGLARLNLKPEEALALQKQLSGILDFVTELKEVNVSDVEPTSHPLSLSNVFREDTPISQNIIDNVLTTSPAHHKTFFEVPKVIEGK